MAVEREFVGLDTPTGARAHHGSHAAQGLYWRPARERPRVAFLAAHYNVDYAEHYLAPLLAARGLGFLGWNTRYRGNEDLFVLEHALVDIGAGLAWLREVAGVEAVVILGNSGGASLMGAYQAQATALDLEASGRLREALEALAPGQAYVSLNSHPGRPDVLTSWMDPSVVDEYDPVATDPALDMYRPENGPPYPEDFQARYRAAQRERNHRITRWAQGELERLREAGVQDRVFPLYRVWADLRFADPAIDPSDRPCPACYAGEPAVANRGVFHVGRASSLRTWLSMWSLEHSVARVSLQLPTVSEPALVAQATADTGCFPSDAHAIFDALGSKDKSLEWLPGAHYFEDAPEHRERAADLLSGWVRSRL